MDIYIYIHTVYYSLVSLFLKMHNNQLNLINKKKSHDCMTGAATEATSYFMTSVKRQTSVNLKHQPVNYS